VNPMSTTQPSPPILDAAPAAISLLGARVHNVSLEEFFASIDRCVQARVPRYIVTPNVDHVVRLETDPDFQRAYSDAYLAVCDSTPLMWAARVMGVAIKQKLSGSDLVHWLSAHAATKGYRLFLFGAAEGVAPLAQEVLEARYPGLQIVGTYSPPMGFERDSDANAYALRQIRDAAPDICFVALGSPKQEKWMCDNVAASGAPLMLGIGAGLDFVVGRFKRAPVWMQRCGFEWLWRLCSDPRRLFKRYIIDDSRFFVIVLRAWIRRRNPPFGPARDTTDT
jgi:N-acetylglucosaminyldiphosphoundecaprenol N-acetyl-beta-D-mannosaminyltransferase